MAAGRTSSAPRNATSSSGATPNDMWRGRSRWRSRPLRRSKGTIMDKAEPTINKVAAEPIAPTKPSPGAKRHVELTVGGMTCTHCPPALEKTLRAIDGVASAHVNLANKLAAVDYDPGRVAVIDLAKAIRAAGYAPGVATTRIPIKSLHCSSCVTRIALPLQMTPDVLSARANPGPTAVDVQYDPRKVAFAPTHGR